MRFRRAATLIFEFVESSPVVHNYLTHDRISCSEAGLEFLAQLGHWSTPRALMKRFPDIEPASLAAQIAKFAKYNIVIIEGTEKARLDQKYRDDWIWGSPAGHFHFSIRATRFITGKRAREFMLKRNTWRKSPSLHMSNKGRLIKAKLPRTDLALEPFRLMRKRRSNRQFDGKPISQQALADCLFSGNGIVDFREDKDYGRLPITMTPSGGARNPFELYVYVQKIEGLVPGFYHYDAYKRDLGLIRPGTVNVPDMLGTQTWPKKAGAIVFLAANFPRSMWKYHMPMAYKVVMMEAGFIGQNIALAATHHGLSAIPSGAIDQELIDGYLNLPKIDSSVILSMNIGRPMRPSDH